MKTTPPLGTIGRVCTDCPNINKCLKARKCRRVAKKEKTMSAHHKTKAFEHICTTDSNPTEQPVKIWLTPALHDKLRKLANSKGCSYALTASEIIEGFLNSIPHEESTLIFSRKHSNGTACWWGADGRGYTEDLNQAGRYTPEQAHCVCSFSHGDSVPVLESVAMSLPSWKSTLTREVELHLANDQAER